MSRVLVEAQLMALLADTTGAPPAGGEAVVGDPFDPSSVVGLGILVVVAVVVVVTAIVLIRRPGSRRPVAALLMLLGTGVVALVFVLAALLSDWSGQHRIAPVPLVIGIIIMVLGLFITVRILRGSSGERGR